VVLAAWIASGTGIGRTRAENRVDYRYEDYAEDDGRIHIQTHGAHLDSTLNSWLSLKANFIHDAISGATPTGAPPIPGLSEVAKVTIEDIRRAGYLEPAIKLENHTLSPQFSYSAESDYESTGLSLSHASDWNDKNTTLTWGVSHLFDRVLPSEGASISDVEDKDTTDFMVGVTQLLGPKTTLTVNLTLGYSEGFLADPYKRVLFEDFPYTPGEQYTVFPEVRPGHRFRQVLFGEIRHYFESLNGSIEGHYRFHHDDWGILAHTVGLAWHQKIGKAVTISPLFRFHTQTAADFYGTSFPGDPGCPPEDDPDCPQIALPESYSADYRLSELNSFTYGISAEARLHKNISVNVSYKRYLMEGTDGVTADDQYPSADVVGGGIAVWF
jgi:hypothetical protein